LSEVNALANFTFLTQETNLLVSDRDPAKYLAMYEKKTPGAIESHWIPIDQELWKVENYREFLAARRDLLAQAANDFLESLVAGNVPESQVTTPVLERATVAVPGAISGEDEEQLILDCAEWVSQHGLPDGEIMFELTDASTNEPVAVFDLAWPTGLQEGLSQPVALLLNESEDVEQVANQAGYRYFTNADLFREYVLREILAIHEDLAAD
jgi:hypothetical protein